MDEDETEFFDSLEMSRKEYERQLANEEAQQLRSFQAAMAAKASVVHELKEVPPVPSPKIQEAKVVVKKNRPLPVNIIVKPQAKKAKTDNTSSEEPSNALDPPSNDTQKPVDNSQVPSSIGLVSYSDESDDD